ncbi:cytochrome P450 301B1 [Tribolium castaneum]|uniref:Cytochrome P450 301B1 n=1 Tax=Tribolium castaneum TaxID=7070 RepID=D2A103_TRICA|nr:cytochrome P450 301B1 [Tribolium castaneum]EFA02807.1 cytochrome P450 301B1 [Tribolium castaneum]|eukprot:NP_001164234.1 cytochrome P450 301B1 [Tribolium castaneum]
MKLLRAAKRVISSSSQQQLGVISAIEENHCKEWADAVPYEEVPGPKPLPFLGNTWRFIPFIGDFQIEHIDKVSKKLYEKYGKIVKMQGLLGRPDMLFLFDPDEIEKVFRQEDTLPYRPSMPSLNYYKHVHRKEFFGDNCGVIAVHGDRWQNFRTKVNQIMLQPRVTRMYVKSIETTSQELVDRIEVIKNKKSEVPDDFLNELHKWSLESIAKIALDVRLGCLDPNAHPDTQTLINAINTFFMNVPILELKIPFWKIWNTPTFKEYLHALDTIREITLKHVDIALHKLSQDDCEELSVLQRVLKMENDAKTASNLALDMFLVGVDTTSNAVASILYQLSLHQEKQAKLYEEIASLLPCKSTQISHEKLDQMHYLKACIKETMRMYPVVIGNGRCTTRDRVIGGYQIPKGVQVIFQHCVISNLEEYFPRSGEFLPERWLKNSELFRNHHPFASLPFGFGKRMCLGRRFADLEIQTVIAKVVRNFKIEYHHDKLDYHIHPMYTPYGPLRLTFIRRQ